MGTIRQVERPLKQGITACIRHGEPSDAQPLLRHLERILSDGTGMVTEPGEISNTLDAEEKWIVDLRDGSEWQLLRNGVEWVLGMLSWKP